MQNNRHLFTDADNTLWDTDSVFAAAQLEMLREIERITGRKAPGDDDRGLAFLRNLDQRIAASHPDHLRYPPSLLAHGLALVLEGRGVDEVAAEMTERDAATASGFEAVEARFVESLQRLPPLRTGVREGLLAVATAHVPIKIVTEASAERCRKHLVDHQLATMVSDVISLRKTTDAYLQLKRKAGGGRCFMVGDQIDRDVTAAAAAGFSTFFFPGGFAPYWVTGHDASGATRIDRYDAIVPEVVGRDG